MSDLTPSDEEADADVTIEESDAVTDDSRPSSCAMATSRGSAGPGVWHYC
jgi:hypothetical protein